MRIGETDAASRAAAPLRAQIQGADLQLWQGEKLEGDAANEGMALSSDRTLAVTTDSQSRLRVWRLSAADLVAQACASGPRRLPEEEALIWLGSRETGAPCGRPHDML